jgi:hypothetical protein
LGGGRNSRQRLRFCGLPTGLLIGGDRVPGPLPDELKDEIAELLLENGTGAGMMLLARVMWLVPLTQRDRLRRLR